MNSPILQLHSIVESNYSVYSMNYGAAKNRVSILPNASVTNHRENLPVSGLRIVLAIPLFTSKSFSFSHI